MGLFTKRYIMSQMEYRTSFFTILIVESLILFSKLLYTVVVYNTDMIVDGLKPEAITMFTGTFFCSLWCIIYVQFYKSTK